MSAMKHFEQQTYYELLEVPVTASEEQIRDAYARAMETYSPDSIAVYTLVEPEQLESLRQQLTQAMEILCALDQRLEYDRKIGVKRSDEELARLRAESLTRAAKTSAGKAPAREAGAPPAAEASPVDETEPVEVEAVTTEELELEEPPAAKAPTTPLAATVVPAPAEPVPAPSATAASAVPPRAPSAGHKPALHSRLPSPRPGSALPPPLPSRNGFRQPPRTGGMAASTTPSASGPEKAKGSPRPPVGQRPGDAPELAQTSAIATAESALAPVSRVARDSRTRLKTVVDIPADAEFNGELLRQVREGRNISLQLLADRTRISSRHVESIEADRYDQLPAGVYLRGMLMSIARELGLDPLRVSRSYMALAAAVEKKPR